METSPRTAPARTLVALGLAQAAIGAAAIFARLALSVTGPLAVAALRLGIAACPVVALALARGAYARRDARTEWRLAIAGLVLALHFWLWFASLQRASVAVATLLVCTTPVFTEAWTALRTGRRRSGVTFGIAAAVAGVAVVAGFPSGRDTPLGMLLATGGAIAFAVYLLLVRASDPRYGTLAVVARTYPVAAIVLGVGAVAAGDHVPPLGASAAWGGIVAMALGSQLFGHSAVNAAVRTLSATLVATTILLEPVIAAVAAAAVFGERLTPATALGAALILAGIGLTVRAESESGV